MTGEEDDKGNGFDELVSSLRGGGSQEIAKQLHDMGNQEEEQGHDEDDGGPRGLPCPEDQAGNRRGRRPAGLVQDREEHDEDPHGKD